MRSEDQEPPPRFSRRAEADDPRTGSVEGKGWLVTRDWTLELPTEWKTAEWSTEHIRPMFEVPVASAVAVQVMLRDGTNMLGLIWPSGQRLLRTGPATGWALQEHFTGTIAPEHRKVLSEIWAKLVQCMVQAGLDADDDMAKMGRAPVRPPRRKR